MGGRVSFAFTGPVCVRAAVRLLDVGWDGIEKAHVAISQITPSVCTIYI